MGLSLLKLPEPPDNLQRNWSTAFIYDRNNNLTIQDFYDQPGLNGKLTLNLDNAKYCFINYHLVYGYPRPRNDFKLYLLNNSYSDLDTANCYASQWSGSQDSPIRTRQQLTETTAASGLEEVSYSLTGDGNELHTSTELLFLELQWH